jgi:uncharacterized protein YgiM (DUF1202 family)
MKKALLSLIAAILFPVALFAADAVYVQSAKARIMKEPNFKSAEAGTAKKGDKLSVLEKGDGWTKISAGPVSGWVNALCLSDSPPLNRTEIINEGTADIASKSRKRASAVTTAAASRGLTDTERKRLSEMGEMDYKSVMRLEKLSSSITEKELDDFVPSENLQ